MASFQLLIHRISTSTKNKDELALVRSLTAQIEGLNRLCLARRELQSLVTGYQGVYNHLAVCRKAQLMCCIPLTAQRLQELLAARAQVEADAIRAADALHQKLGLLRTFAVVNESMVPELSAVGMHQLAQDKGQLAEDEQQFLKLLEAELLAMREQLSTWQQQQQQQRHGQQEAMMQQQLLQRSVVPQQLQERPTGPQGQMGQQEQQQQQQQQGLETEQQTRLQGPQTHQQRDQQEQEKPQAEDSTEPPGPFLNQELDPESKPRRPTCSRHTSGTDAAAADSPEQPLMLEGPQEQRQEEQQQQQDATEQRG